MPLPLLNSVHLRLLLPALLSLGLAPAAFSATPANIGQRVDDLLARMTLAEKIGQMCQIASSKGTIPDDLRQRLRQGKIGSMLNETDPATSLEIQRIATQESRLGIPLLMGRDVIHGYRTIFPIPLGQSAAWDPQLVRDCARGAAREASTQGFHWTFGPMMDISRDPRWGRIAEGFGEDPYLASALAAAMVRGFQGEDLSNPDSIAACAKHFAAYGAAEGGRDYDTVNMSENLLRDIYLPPFRAAVDAGAATFMTSFNELNGVPASGNALLLRKILREEWGFRGFVVSDWRAIAEMIDHGFCKDLEDAATKSALAGVDMEMASTAYADNLEKLVGSGKVPRQVVDDAVRNILRVKFRLGLMEKPMLRSAAKLEAPSPEYLALAKKAAIKSAVLLKNEGKLLPLSRDVGSIAVIGPLADDPYEILGTWNRDGQTSDTITPLAALKTFLGQPNRINYAPGVPFSRSKDTSGIALAVEQAKKSDVVVLFVGEESILSGEGHSRALLDLPGAQAELVEQMARTGKPIVLVVLAGRPLTLAPIIEKSRAVLYAWHPGTMTGPALADLLFGVESPSGKLPITFPKTEGQIPIYYAHKNTGRPPESKQLTMIDDIPLRAYQSSLGDAARYLDVGYKPLYPFGYGLSYTQFKYANLRISSPRAKLAETLTVTVDLTNSGDRAAEEIAQLYVRELVASLTRPVKELKGFQKMRLDPGQTRTLTFELPIKTLGFHDNQMHYVVEPGTFHLWVGGDSQSGVDGAFEVIP